MSSRCVSLGGILFLFFYLPSAIAQIGFKAGPGISDIGFLEYGQTPYLGYDIGILVHRKPMPTIQAGAFYTFRLGKRLDFQPELLFITQGLDYSTGFLYDDVTYKLKASYLHAPLLLKYQTSLKRNWRPALYSGPYVSLKLQAVRLTEIEGRRERTPLSNVNGLDVGLVAGFSVEFGLPAGEMTAGIRASYSLINMMDRVEGYIPDYYKSPEKAYARNISVSLLVGYRFGAKKERQ